MQIKFFILHTQGQIQIFWNGVVLKVGHHGWPKKIVRWSKKAKITLETIGYWQNISVSIFTFSPFIYTVKACQWNLINFSKFANALFRKEKNHLCSSQWEKKNEKSRTLLLFYSPLIWYLIFFVLFCKLICSPIFAFWFQDDLRNIKRGSRERQIARNGKLQYLFQK